MYHHELKAKPEIPQMRKNPHPLKREYG